MSRSENEMPWNDILCLGKKYCKTDTQTSNSYIFLKPVLTKFCELIDSAALCIEITGKILTFG